jgi:hypothetical protein
MSSILPLVALALTGCTKDGDSGDTAPPCTTIVKETSPAADSTNAYYRQTIRAKLDQPDTTAMIMMDLSGTSSVSEDGKIVTYTLDTPMDSSASYSYTVMWCDGEQSADINFQTNSLGTPLADVNVLDGQVYSLDLGADSVEIVTPSGVGSVLESYLDIELFLQVNDATDTSLDIFGALGDEDNAGNQDFCTETLDFPEADFSGQPYFQIGPEDTNISVAGFSVTIADLLVSGDFASDGSFWGGGTLAGLIDTRPLVDLIEEGGEDNAVCELVSGFGVECITCPEDGQDFCLEIEAVGLGGDSVDITLETIEMSDCHELCTASADNPECELE